MPLGSSMPGFASPRRVISCGASSTVIRPGTKRADEAARHGERAVECVLHGVARPVERQPDAASQREVVGRWARIAAKLLNQLEVAFGGDDIRGQIAERRVRLAEIDRRGAFDIDDAKCAIGVETPDLFLRPVVRFRRCVERCRRTERATGQFDLPLTRFDLHLEVPVSLEACGQIALDCDRFEPFRHRTSQRDDSMAAGHRQIDERRQQHRHAVVDASIDVHRQGIVGHFVRGARRFAEPQPCRRRSAVAQPACRRQSAAKCRAGAATKWRRAFRSSRSCRSGCSGPARDVAAVCHRAA